MKLIPLLAILITLNLGCYSNEKGINNSQKKKSSETEEIFPVKVDEKSAQKNFLQLAMLYVKVNKVTNPYIWANLSSAYAKLNKPKVAKALIERAIVNADAVEPEREKVNYYFMIATSLAYSPDFMDPKQVKIKELVKKCTNILLKLTKDEEAPHGWFYYNLACLHAKLGEEEKGKEALANAISFFAEPKEKELKLQGDFYAALGNEKKALSFYSSFLKKNQDLSYPMKPFDLCSSIGALCQLKQYTKAKEILPKLENSIDDSCSEMTRFMLFSYAYAYLKEKQKLKISLIKYLESASQLKGSLVEPLTLAAMWQSIAGMKTDPKLSLFIKEFFQKHLKPDLDKVKKNPARKKSCQKKILPD